MHALVAAGRAVRVRTTEGVRGVSHAQVKSKENCRAAARLDAVCNKWREPFDGHLVRPRHNLISDHDGRVVACLHAYEYLRPVRRGAADCDCVVCGH